MTPEEIRLFQMSLQALTGVVSDVTTAKVASAENIAKQNLLEKAHHLKEIDAINNLNVKSTFDTAAKHYGQSTTNLTNLVKQAQLHGINTEELYKIGDKESTNAANEINESLGVFLNDNLTYSFQGHKDAEMNLNSSIEATRLNNEMSGKIRTAIGKIENLHNYMDDNPFSEIAAEHRVDLNTEGGVPGVLDKIDIEAWSKTDTGKKMFEEDPWLYNAALKEITNVSGIDYGFIPKQTGTPTTASTLNKLEYGTRFDADESRFAELQDLHTDDNKHLEYLENKSGTNININLLDVTPLSKIQFDKNALSKLLDYDPVTRHQQVSPSVNRVAKSLDVLLSFDKMDVTKGTWSPTNKGGLDIILGEKGKPGKDGWLYFDDKYDGTWKVDDKKMDKVIKTDEWWGDSLYEAHLREEIKNQAIMFKTLQDMQIAGVFTKGNNLSTEGLADLVKLEASGLPLDKREDEVMKIIEKWGTQSDTTSVPQDTTAINQSLDAMSEEDYIKSNPYLDDYEKRYALSKTTNEPAERARQNSVIKSTIEGVRADILQGKLSREDAQNALTVLEDYFPERELSDSTRVKGWPKTKPLPKAFSEDELMQMDTDSLSPSEKSNLIRVLNNLQIEGYEIPDSLWP